MGDQVIDPKPDQDPPPSNDNVPGWISGVPDEFKERDEVKSHKTVGGFVKESLDDRAAHAELKTKIETAIFKPGENATDEEKLTFRTSMGVPEKPEGYNLTNGDVEHSPEFETWFRGVAHEIGMSQEEVTNLVPRFDAYMEGIVEGVAEAKEKAVTDAEASLKTEWGSQYPENIEFTRRGFERFFEKDEAFKGFLEEGGLGNDPRLLKMVFKFGKAMGDDWSPSGTVRTIQDVKQNKFTYPNSPAPPNKE